MLLLIDNYDSFTYNIVHYINEIGFDVTVILNDDMTAPEILSLEPSKIIISPGPGAPEESGVSFSLLEEASKLNIPTLGVCLGHEIIGKFFGANVMHADRVMHGKRSIVFHNDENLFNHIENPFYCGRYHSLIIDKRTLPRCLEITAWTQDDDGKLDEVMGIRHRTLPIYGVQFHPESVLTNFGHQLLGNFLGINLNLSLSHLNSVKKNVAEDA